LRRPATRILRRLCTLPVCLREVISHMTESAPTGRQRPGRHPADLGVVDGKHRRKSFYGKTQRQVRDRLNEALHAHQRGVLPKAAGKTTVEQWLATWLRSIEGTVRPRTLEHYRWLVDKHLGPSIGRKQLSRLTPRDIEVMLNAK